MFNLNQFIMEDEELEKLADKLTELEWQLLCDWGLKNINGGFVELEYYDYDDDFIYLECTSGKLDGGKIVEELKMDRETLELYD